MVYHNYSHGLLLTLSPDYTARLRDEGVLTEIDDQDEATALQNKTLPTYTQFVKDVTATLFR